jgi:hypothetical protein
MKIIKILDTEKKYLNSKQILQFKKNTLFKILNRLQYLMVTKFKIFFKKKENRNKNISLINNFFL